DGTLLGIFSKRVDRREIDRLVLVGGDRGQRCAVCARYLPLPSAHSGRIAPGVPHPRAVAVAIEALAVDAHRRGYDDSAHRAAYSFVDQRLEQDRGTEVVGTDIAVDFIHALADANLRRQVDNVRDTFEGAPNRSRVANIGADD